MSGTSKFEIAVSMPAWNAGRFIGTAIESVLAQEGVALELVVVDDASTDDTAAVVARYQDARLRYVRTDQRRGIGYCHNLAVRLTSADLVAHVDADDVILPDALAAMAAAARHPNVGQAYCDSTRSMKLDMRSIAAKAERSIARARRCSSYAMGMLSVSAAVMAA